MRNKEELHRAVEDCDSLETLRYTVLGILEVCDARETVFWAQQRTGSTHHKIPMVWTNTIREFVAESVGVEVQSYETW